MKRILICVGGTGGHVYPAKVLADDLVENGLGEVLFVGGGLFGSGCLEGYQYRRVWSSRLSKNPFKLVKGMLLMFMGFWQSVWIIRKFKPELVIGFGSHYTFPPLLAALVFKVPMVLHEANVVPGKVNRFLGPRADLVGITFPPSEKYFWNKAELAMRQKNGKKEFSAEEGGFKRVQVVGFPLRRRREYSEYSVSEARKHFGLEGEVLTILVFGGSQGSIFINQCMQEATKQLLEQGIRFQLIHLLGKNGDVSSTEKYYASLGLKAGVKLFEHHMEIAWRAASLVICRAGAASIAEMLYWEVPGILIPYPYSSDDHQQANAEFMVKEMEGAVAIEQKQLDGFRLAEKIATLIQDEAWLLKRYKEALRSFKQSNPTPQFASLIRQFLQQS